MTIPQTPRLLNEARNAVEAAEVACNPHVSIDDLKIAAWFQPTRAFCNRTAAYYQFNLTAERTDAIGDAARTARHLTAKEMIGAFYTDQHEAEKVYAMVYCLNFTDAVSTSNATLEIPESPFRFQLDGVYGVMGAASDFTDQFMVQYVCRNNSGEYVYELLSAYGTTVDRCSCDNASRTASCVHALALQKILDGAKTVEVAK